jgi:hypothetical protein
MKAYVGMEAEFHTLLTSALNVVVSLTCYHFSPGGKYTAHTEYEAGCTPEIVQTVSKRGKCLAPAAM